MVHSSRSTVAGVRSSSRRMIEKERRFARAIGADQRDALAVVHLQRGVLEQGAATDGFPSGLEW